MKNENYILIQGWMINELKLSGNELLVYSIIYGFSQDGESNFQGSSNYIAECLNISQRSVFTILQKLVEKDLIRKIDNVKFVNYKINNEILNFTKTSGGDMKNFHRGYEETSYNNTIYNTNNIRKEIVKDEVKDDFITYEYCKQIYTKANCYEFNIVKFFNYYKDKGIKKEQVEHLMTQWDMRENQFKQQSQKKDEKTSVDTFFKQLGVSEQDLKEYSEFKKRSENV